MTKIRVHVTKDVLHRSANCINEVGLNCAVALAINELLPNSWVSLEEILIFRNTYDVHNYTKGFDYYTPDIILLPQEASDFIMAFDSALPEKRIQMEPISFEIDIPDHVMEHVTNGSIEEVNRIISQSKTLEYAH